MTRISPDETNSRTFHSPPSIKEARSWGVKQLMDAHIDAPQVACEILLAGCLDIPRLNLPLKLEETLQPEQWNTFSHWIHERARHKPIEYITGTTSFYNREFYVDNRVMIPRPETEGLVRIVLKQLEKIIDSSGSKSIRVCDAGTGSGVIAITLCLEHPAVKVTAVDVSHDALEVAQHNARKHGVSERIQFLQTDLLTPGTSPFPLEPAPFHLIVSNPPYIEKDEMNDLKPEVKQFEPEVALTAPGSRAQVYRRLCAFARRHLSEEGTFGMECSEYGTPSVQQLCSSGKFEWGEFRRDYRGVQRFFLGGT